MVVIFHSEAMAVCMIDREWTTPLQQSVSEVKIRKEVSDGWDLAA